MMRAATLAVMALAIAALSTPAPANDLRTLLAQRAPLPKGSYQQSCQCELSGGVTLLCVCANLQGRYFNTTLDVRQCTLPKDIKNCNGNLTCVEPKGEC
jgi:hypothetical protein